MKSKRALTLSVALLLVGLSTFAAGKPLTITADQLSYDGQTKVATASGAVVIQDGENVMTGASGWYNTESRESFLKGGESPVQVKGPQLAATAAEIHSYNDERIVATGNAFLQKEDRVIKGDKVDYNNTLNYGTVEGNAYLKTKDATMTGDHVEAWMNEIRAIGQGNVKLVSDTHQMVATGNRVDYHQTPNQDDGVAYLSGNAYAEQNGNTLQGDAFTIRLAEDSIQTQGRSTLVIQPR